MITKEKFIELVNNHINWIKRLDEIEKILKTDIIETDWVSYGDRLFNDIMKICFDKHGYDNICWWIYEKRVNSELTIRNENEDIIPSETINDLWELVKNNII